MFYIIIYFINYIRVNKNYNNNQIIKIKFKYHNYLYRSITMYNYII